MSRTSDLERVERTSADVNAARIEELKQLFPEAFTEGKIDFEKLRATLGDTVDDAPERYSFTWAGKRDAIRLLQAPTRATLVPARDESINFDETNHVFIEGDNLEVLKLLYKAYFGKVKMIYIDPPYNTGNDFVYPDNYADPLETYLRLTGQKDAEGNILSSNTDTSGRYHSSWLNMMYPRLFLARQFLQDDGVIFVSIDDNEEPNVRLLLNEIFGEENWLATFAWKSRQMVDNRAKTGISNDHEYILCYGKTSDARLRGSEKDLSKFGNPDNDPRGPWRSADLTGLATEDRRPNLHYDLKDPSTGITYDCPPKGWRYDRKTMGSKIAEGRVIFPEDGIGRPRHKLFRNEMGSLYMGFSTVITDVHTTHGTRDIQKIFDRPVIQFPKPVKLLQSLVEQATEPGDIILDFFAGSCSSAQAVIMLNENDRIDRRFVMVQLPEPTADSEYKTIADIGKERIRRVFNQLNEDERRKLAFGDQHDYGFRVFSLVPTSFKEWQGAAEATPDRAVEQMVIFSDSLKVEWVAEDVIWEVAIKEGFPLNSRITHANVGGQTVYRVTNPDDEQQFHICLDDKVTADVPRRLGLGEEELFVCRDTALDDTTAANLALACRLKVI